MNKPNIFGSEFLYVFFQIIAFIWRIGYDKASLQLTIRSLKIGLQCGQITSTLELRIKNHSCIRIVTEVDSPLHKGATGAGNCLEWHTVLAAGHADAICSREHLEAQNPLLVRERHQLDFPFGAVVEMKLVNWSNLKAANDSVYSCTFLSIPAYSCIFLYIPNLHIIIRVYLCHNSVHLWAW